jgi:hypothetical protein
MRRKNGWGSAGRPARRFAQSLVPAWALALAAAGGLAVGCAKPTLLKVVSDPPGAEVEIGGVGMVGKTPLDYPISRREVQALNKSHGGERIALPVTLTMRSFLTERELVRMKVGSVYTHFVRLEPRNESVSITSEPEGVGVFELNVDEEAGSAVRMLFDSDPMGALEKHAKWITRHFIGSTPIRYQYDAEHPLDQNDVLLFQKAGYHSQLSYVKERESRIHVIMMPQVIEAR